MLYKSNRYQSLKPLVDLETCLKDIAKGKCNQFSGQAMEMHLNGFCKYNPNNERWFNLVEIGNNFLDKYQNSNCIDIEKNYILNDIMDSNLNSSLLEIASNKDLNALIQNCYGRDPLIFETKSINIKNSQILFFNNDYESAPKGFWLQALIFLDDFEKDNQVLKIFNNNIESNLPFFKSHKSSDNFSMENKLFNKKFNTIMNKYAFKFKRAYPKKGDIFLIKNNILLSVENFKNSKKNNRFHIINYYFKEIQLRKKEGNLSRKLEIKEKYKKLYRTNFKEKLFFISKKKVNIINQNHQEKIALNLSGTPLIDSDAFEFYEKQGFFGPLYKQAIQLNKFGFCTLHIQDPLWLNLISSIRLKLEKYFDIKSLKAGNLKSSRIQDAWDKLKIDEIRKLACHPEILASLRILYGRNPFPFQTLNFPNGTRQHFHSDAVHFHCIPKGFMCGVWVAFEDIHPDSGPLIYYPKSHKLPYRSSKNLNLTRNEVNSIKNPQKFFEESWRKQVEENSFLKVSHLPKKGDVLIWHANLLHGGDKVLNKSLTRWSQVNHYFFEGCAYNTPLFETIDALEDEYKWRDPLNLTKFS